MKPLVSIVITTYNYACYLPRCLDSVFAQTYGKYEVILINDGSTDNTDEVLAPYFAKDGIKYIKQKNAGQTKAKNNGIRRSSGDFIAFLDADDYWMKDKLEKQLAEFAKDREFGVVYTRAAWVDENDQPRKNNAPKPHSGWVTDALVVDNFVPFSSALVKRQCLDQAGVFDESLEMGIDWDLWLKISKHFKFTYIDQNLTTYRVGHPSQMSKKQARRQQYAGFILQRFIEENPGIISKSAIRRAEAYTYRNRGDYYARIDRKTALHYNFKSLALNPAQPRIYLRILKSLLTPDPKNSPSSAL